MTENIRFRCTNPSCLKRLKAPKEHVSRRARCTCGQSVVVPSPEPLPLDEATATRKQVMWINTKQIVTIYCLRSQKFSGEIQFGQTTTNTYDLATVYPVFPAVVGVHSSELLCPICGKQATVHARVSDRNTRIREYRWFLGCILFILGVMLTVPMLMVSLGIKLNDSEHYSILTRVLWGLGAFATWSVYTGYLVWGIPYFEEEGYDAAIGQGSDKMYMHHTVTVSGK